MYIYMYKNVLPRPPDAVTAYSAGSEMLIVQFQVVNATVVGDWGVVLTVDLSDLWSRRIIFIPGNWYKSLTKACRDHWHRLLEMTVGRDFPPSISFPFPFLPSFSLPPSPPVLPVFPCQPFLPCLSSLLYLSLPFPFPFPCLYPYILNPARGPCGVL